MIENLTISISFSGTGEAYVSNYFCLSEVSGESLIVQKPDNIFYFLYINSCSIVDIRQSFDWYIVSKSTFNDCLIIGIGLSDKEGINRELYRVQDETTFTLWRNILCFAFESDFVCRFSPYNIHFRGKMRIDGALCFYIHDYYPTRCEDIPTSDRKTSNLVFRFREGRQAALVARIFSLCTARAPFFKEEAASIVLILIPAAAREYNLTHFARFYSSLSHRSKVVGGSRATWVEEDCKQMRGTHGQDKLSNSIFHPNHSKGRDVLLIDDIISSGENSTQIRCKLIRLGVRSVTGLFLGKTVKFKNQK